MQNHSFLADDDDGKIFFLAFFCDLTLVRLIEFMMMAKFTSDLKASAVFISTDPVLVTTSIIPFSELCLSAT